MADRLIVMQAGRAAQIATPMEVFERPANLFVAQFIGSPSMNILDPQKAGLKNIPAHVTIGIRPEHVVISDTGSLFTVNLVEPLGSETLIHGNLACGQTLTLRQPGGPPGADQLHIILPADAMHSFDSNTGIRIKTFGQT